MTKANITIVLVPEVLSKNKRRIEKQIARSLQCDWLLKVEKVAVSHNPVPNNDDIRHHRMPDGKEVSIYG
jgi:pseudouridine-5'-phosphate glycosidase